MRSGQHGFLLLLHYIPSIGNCRRNSSRSGRRSIHCFLAWLGCCHSTDRKNWSQEAPNIRKYSYAHWLLHLHANDQKSRNNRALDCVWRNLCVLCCLWLELALCVRNSRFLRRIQLIHLGHGYTVLNCFQFDTGTLVVLLMPLRTVKPVKSCFFCEC